MPQAIANLEYTTVSAGMRAADTMVKSADVEIIEAQVVCPGKYIALIRGELSAVKAASEAAKRDSHGKLIDSFVLGNPHPSIFPAIYGTTEVEDLRALGVFETYSASSIIVAADIAAKCADVTLIELRIAKGMCGKSYMTLTGEVAAVEAAISAAKKGIADTGMYLDSEVIARPDKKMRQKLL